MTYFDKQDTAVLRPLILSCLPEFNPKLELGCYELPPLFAEPEAVISYSAQQAGWGRGLSQTIRVYCPADKERLFLKLELYDLLLVNPLSLNTLAKFALGIQDSLPTQLLWRFSSMGKPILLNEGCLPNEGSSLCPHLLKVYKRYWQAVIEGSVASFNNDNLAQTASRLIRAKRAAAARFAGSSGRVFITKDDVIAASETLEPIRVPYSAIITDTAQEEANDRGVVIIRE